MNKLDFVNEIGILANRFASLFQNYTASHDGYGSETESGKPIIVGNIGVSVQNGELATISVDIGCSDSKHRIQIDRYPDSANSEWRIEDK